MIIKEEFSAYCIPTSLIKNKQDCMIVLEKKPFLFYLPFGWNELMALFFTQLAVYSNWFKM
jgi:hypothetical protein